MLIAGIAALFFQSCKEVFVPQKERPTVDQFDNTTLHRWNKVFLQMERYAAGYRPGPASHALGHLTFSAYEAVVPGMPGNNSLANYYADLNIPKFDESLEYYWPAVINESNAYMMRRLFFHMEAVQASVYDQIELTRSQLHDQYVQETTPEILKRSEERGREVAQAVSSWEEKDLLSHNAFLNPQPPYDAPHGPGIWEPTFPDFSAGMFPSWGQVRTFAIREDEKLARVPVPFSENPQSLFYAQAMEVFTRVENIKEGGQNAFQDRWLSEFWSDDNVDLTFSPASRLFAIADQLVTLDNLNLAEGVELYAKLGMALNDAAVSVLHSKYYYNVERPVSYIRRVLALEHPKAAEFTTGLNNPMNNTQGITPATPSYPSEHAGFGGAGGKILSSFFEFNSKHPGTLSFADECHKGRSEFLGLPRVLHSMRDMANEDAYSRIPLGVHFRMDCDEGIRLGELAAQRVLELPWKK